jgi:uncharacterized glyoxalase superfamily protein PhnB
MFIPHLHFSDYFGQAIEMYVKAFDTTINEIIFIDKEKPEKGVSPMKATDFTPCTVGFWDKYGIRWDFMVQ